nr:MAG TPA: hypothetical protein [Caudoviricetes sp.]
MIYRISSLFEQDLEVQDCLENADGMYDNSDDMIISVIEHRHQDRQKANLFENDLSLDEEDAINASALDYDDEDLDDDEEDYYEERDML